MDMKIPSLLGLYVENPIYIMGPFRNEKTIELVKNKQYL